MIDARYFLSASGITEDMMAAGARVLEKSGRLSEGPSSADLHVVAEVFRAMLVESMKIKPQSSVKLTVTGFEAPQSAGLEYWRYDPNEPSITQIPRAGSLPPSAS